jgi:aspartyl aminopeptidase
VRSALRARGRLAAHRCSMAAKRSAAEAAASEEAPGFAARFLGYINETPTPFHLCAVTAAKLQSAGFSELSESDAWASSGSVVAGGKYFYTRCASSRASTVRSVRC